MGTADAETGGLVAICGERERRAHDMEPTQIRKERRQTQIRDSIFNHAIKLADQYGYENVTVRMICSEAGISIGMFYRNFDSKGDVLLYFYEHAVQAYEETLRETLINYPARERLIRFYVWITDFTSNLGLEFVKCFFSTHRKAQKSDFLDNQVAVLGTELLDNAVNRGELKLSSGRSALAVTHDILIIVKGILFDWCISSETYDLAGYTQVYLDRVVDSLL